MLLRLIIIVFCKAVRETIIYPKRKICHDDSKRFNYFLKYELFRNMQKTSFMNQKRVLIYNNYLSRNPYMEIKKLFWN